MSMFKELTRDEEVEFRKGAREDNVVKDFVRYMSLCHPVHRDEVAKILKEVNLK